MTFYDRTSFIVFYLGLKIFRGHEVPAKPLPHWFFTGATPSHIGRIKMDLRQGLTDFNKLAL